MIATGIEIDNETAIGSTPRRAVDAECGRHFELFSAALCQVNLHLPLWAPTARYRIERLRLAFGTLSVIVCLTTAHR